MRRAFPGLGDSKNFLWRVAKSISSESTSVACNPSEKGAMTDLFGETVKVVSTHKKHKRKQDETADICVTIKLTTKEFETLVKMADKFGMSKSRYCRDAVRQILHDHECLLQP
jgi:hypothetical protein